MIRLHPRPDQVHNCPYCQIPLEVLGWYIPGMRNLADLRCQSCGRRYYGDLLAGHGLYYPMLLERESDQVHDANGINWFANWLRDSYANRQDTPLEMSVESLRPLKRPLLLNCLDALYGHALLKLLNAQYYIDRTPEYDLVLLIPRFLRWAVPDGVAAIWTVDLPLRDCMQWNDWLAAELHRLLGHFAEAWLSVAFSHPHPEDFDVARFTKVKPFPIDEWQDRLVQPTITFIWREDRLWSTNCHDGSPQTFKGRTARQFLGRKPDRRQQQAQLIQELAEQLRQRIKELRFAVAGLGAPGGYPTWMNDLRTQQIDAAVERMWCEQYARSHVVIGVHGSSMLLPSAHAGATIELVPPDRWGNVVQDILVSNQDVREALARHRLLPLTTSSPVVAEITTSLLRDLSFALLNFRRPWNDHAVIKLDPRLVFQRRRRIKVAIDA